MDMLKETNIDQSIFKSYKICQEQGLEDTRVDEGDDSYHELSPTSKAVQNGYLEVVQFILKYHDKEKRLDEHKFSLVVLFYM